MNLRRRNRWPIRSCMLALVLVVAMARGADTIEINDAGVDHASLRVPAIARDESFTISVFDVSQVDLGNAKHRDTAERAAASVPHLLAVDIVESLRDAGFSNVLLGDGDPTSKISELNLHGRFTKIDPGSQAARAWVGFGAGESSVCVDGVISDQSGKQLGYFSHCSKGLGWGKSDGQLDKNTVRIGQSIANFLQSWSRGEFAD